MFIMRQATDSLAVVEFQIEPTPDSQGKILAGELYGPTCSRARTLPAAYACQGQPSPGVARITIPDPCYWTPSLPMLYQLSWSWGANDPSSKRDVGLSQLTSHRDSLRLADRRFVLRGVACKQIDDSFLAEANQAEVAVWTAIDQLTCLPVAAQQGVWLVLDLSHRVDWDPHTLNETIQQLSWSCPVAAAVLSRPQFDALHEQFEVPPGCLNLAQSVHPATDQRAISPRADWLALDLAHGDAPPEWIANLKRPVIVRQHQQAYANLQQARAACDRLQAGCAPAFDLAGYFVAP